MKQKKYMDIPVWTEENSKGFQKGDKIVVQEKIDGANFSLRYSEEKDRIVSFGREDRLSLGNSLRGAWEWSQRQDKEVIKQVLGSKLVLFGEWLCPHTVLYPEDKYQTAYFYDVWDLEEQKYLTQGKVETIVKQLGFSYVPVLYQGEFSSWEQVKALVGTTALGGTQGEGVVVKNMTAIQRTETEERFPFYLKIVGEKFKETKAVKGLVKLLDTEEAERKEKLRAALDSVVTEARVRKLVHKMVDKGTLPENWGKRDLGTISKKLGTILYEDCLKEEPDIVELVGEEVFRKMCIISAMPIVRAMMTKTE